MLKMEKSNILAKNALNHSRRDITWRHMKECTLERGSSHVTDAASLFHKAPIRELMIKLMMTRDPFIVINAGVHFSFDTLP